jgi:DNA-binding beta-propeller fold protein YncE
MRFGFALIAVVWLATGYSAWGATLLVSYGGAVGNPLVNTIQGFREDGSQFTYASSLKQVGLMRFGPDGSLYAATSGFPANGITKIAPDGSRTFIGPVSDVSGIAFDAAGTLFVHSLTSAIFRFAPDGTRTLVYDTNFGAGLEFDHQGNMFFVQADSGGQEVFKTAPGGTPVVFAPTGNPTLPGVTAIDSHDNLYMSSPEGATLKFAPDGSVTTVFPTAGYIAVDNNDNLYILANAATPTFESIYEIAPDGATSIFATFPAHSQNGLLVLIPEPSTWVLLVMGAVAMVWQARRSVLRKR